MKDMNNNWQILERWVWKLLEKFSLDVVFEVEVLLSSIIYLLECGFSSVNYMPPN